jgi:putrescine aminotransferase
VALENLRILNDEDLVARSNVIGAYLAKQLSTRLHDNPRVGEVRQAGMAIGIELVTDKASRQPLPLPALQIADYVRREKSVIARICNYSSLCLSPPLIMTESEADQVAEAVSSVLARVRSDGTVE